MKANIGSVTVEDIPVMSALVKPIFVNKLFAADKGALTPGLVVSENAGGEAIPTVLVADADMTGTVDGVNKVFTYAHGEAVCPGSVVITHGVQTITDDGHGNLIGDGSGTVTYKTGAISVTFDTAPATLAPVVDLASDPYGISCDAVETTTGDTRDTSGRVAVFGSAITANIFLSGGAALTAAVKARLRAEGVYCE